MPTQRNRYPTYPQPVYNFGLAGSNLTPTPLSDSQFLSTVGFNPVSDYLPKRPAPAPAIQVPYSYPQAVNVVAPAPTVSYQVQANDDSLPISMPVPEVGYYTDPQKSFLEDMKAAWDEMQSFNKFKTVLGTVDSLTTAWNAHQQSKLARDTLNFNKQSFNTQWNAQRNLTNSQLEDRQQRRVRADPRNMSVAEYMNKYGV